MTAVANFKNPGFMTSIAVASMYFYCLWVLLKLYLHTGAGSSVLFNWTNLTLVLSVVGMSPASVAES